MPPKEKYSDPGLRDKVKEEVHKSDKGGAPGQWSARKAQLMASEYKKKGGGYNQDKETGQDASQKSLSHWGAEDWQTKEGSGEAKQADGSRKRYLPKKAWEEMNEEEKEETEAAKQKGSKAGQQHVPNTEKANKSRKKAAVADDKEEEEEAEPRPKRAKKETKDESKAKGKDAKPAKSDEKAATKSKTGSKSTGSTGKGKAAQPKAEEAKKGSAKSKTTDASAEKNKKARPTADHGEKGSKDRLPKKGQSVFWKAMPGMVEGEVLEILTSETTVEGKKVKATEDAPQVKLKSHSSGKICVHKIDTVFF